MNFMEAVKAMKEGKRVRRRFWSNTSIFILFDRYKKMIDESKVAQVFLDA